MPYFTPDAVLGHGAKMSKTKYSRGKRFRNDRNGGIEGLPLQLMILVLIAGVGTAVMMGWMTNLKAPASINSVVAEPGEIVLTDSDSNGIYSEDGIDIKIHVLDQTGSGVEGAMVVLDGCNIVTEDGTTAYAKTDSTGTATFTGLSATYAGGNLGFITVKVSKGGAGTDSSYSIPVVCG
ncbi:MAG: hypothetical protein A4E32_02129 [Methanomassiliicoccales archaeon PtaU1.Bin124]|nr:MAG: hypothetical protein A4E32_02129 [Methanomassiliicoccales archaeon PtaU1.Bin124]